jgi:hypothetical protein
MTIRVARYDTLIVQLGLPDQSHGPDIGDLTVVTTW